MIFAFYLLLFLTCVNCYRIVCVVISLVIKLHLGDSKLNFSICFELYQNKLNSLNLCINQFSSDKLFCFRFFKFTNERDCQRFKVNAYRGRSMRIGFSILLIYSSVHESKYCCVSIRVYLEVQIFVKVMFNKLNVVNKVFNFVDIDIHFEKASWINFWSKLNSKNSSFVLWIKSENLTFLAFHFFKHANSSILSVLDVHNFWWILDQVLWELIVFFLNCDKESVMSLFPFNS